LLQLIFSKFVFVPDY